LLFQKPQVVGIH